MSTSFLVLKIPLFSPFQDSKEAAAKAQELTKALDRLRAGVHGLRGVDCGPKEQQARLARIRKQRDLRKKLLEKYRNMNVKLTGLTGASNPASNPTNGTNGTAQ